MFNLRTLSSILALIGLLATGQSLANDINAHTIPASMCTPASILDAQKLTLGTTGWQFSYPSTGYVTLYCPLPLNVYGGNYGTTAKDIYNYRVYYRDSDGVGANARLYTYFNELSIGGLVSFSGFWDSNSVSQTSYNAALKFFQKDLQWGRLNGFYVRMYRANTSQYPAFGGIDFNVFIVL